MFGKKEKYVCRMYAIFCNILVLGELSFNVMCVYKQSLKKLSVCHGIVFNQRQPLETVDPWNLDIWRKLLVCVCSENLITRNSFLSGLSIQRTMVQEMSTKIRKTSFRVY